MTALFCKRTCHAFAFITQCAFLAGCGADASVTAPTSPLALRLTPPPPAAQLPTVARIDIEASFVGGMSGSGTIVLSGEAPASGVEVTLFASDVSLVVPPTVRITAGLLSGIFMFNSAAVTSVRDVVITVASGGQTRTVTVQLRPPATQR